MLSTVNPFSKRDTHDAQTVWFYKVTTIITWLLVVASSVYYNYHAPTDDKCGHTIWGQNGPTPFALNPIIVDIYW